MEKLYRTALAVFIGFLGLFFGYPWRFMNENDHEHDGELRRLMMDDFDEGFLGMLDEIDRRGLDESNVQSNHKDNITIPCGVTYFIT